VNQGYTQVQRQPNETEKIDPYTAQMLIYRAEMYILLRYPYLIDLNLKNENILESINENSLFYVIKSFSEEDVHKAVKYNVWTSTKTGNQTLNNSFKIAKERGGDVYLFFSCNGSGRFVGVARMKTSVDYTKAFPYWTQDNKWGGLFDIEWVMIKDVLFREFKNVVITLKDGERKSVTNSRDTQEVPYQEGRQMVEIIKNYSNTNTILEHFEYYDLRQENYEKNNPQILQRIAASSSAGLAEVSN
jgi:hypothetical protein